MKRQFSEDTVNDVISTLVCPLEDTNVTAQHSNYKTVGTQVQAYAKIAAQKWTYYVKRLEIKVGRTTDDEVVEIDLGPSKVVSRSHARIVYNYQSGIWELEVVGRNGAKIDDQKIALNRACALRSGSVIEIGGTQMMFILPDRDPEIAPQYLQAYAQNAKRMKQVSAHVSASLSANMPSQTQVASQGPGQMHQMAVQMMHNGNGSSYSSMAMCENIVHTSLAHDSAKHVKPPHSYATMITQAILSTPSGEMSLSDIYQHICDNYAYYRFANTGWQNSVRHNLSLYKAFEKVPRRPNEPGKGMKWRISVAYIQEFLNKMNDKSAKSRTCSVTKQLHSYYKIHKRLPGMPTALGEKNVNVSTPKKKEPQQVPVMSPAIWNLVQFGTPKKDSPKKKAFDVFLECK